MLLIRHTLRQVAALVAFGVIGVGVGSLLAPGVSGKPIDCKFEACNRRTGLCDATDVPYWCTKDSITCYSHLCL